MWDRNASHLPSCAVRSPLGEEGALALYLEVSALWKVCLGGHHNFKRHQIKEELVQFNITHTTFLIV